MKYTKKDASIDALMLYPKGTKFISAYSGDKFTSCGEFQIHSMNNSVTCKRGGCVWMDGKWAEIIYEEINYEIY